MDFKDLNYGKFWTFLSHQTCRFAKIKLPQMFLVVLGLKCETRLSCQCPEPTNFYPNIHLMTLTQNKIKQKRLRCALMLTAALLTVVEKCRQPQGQTDG